MWHSFYLSYAFIFSLLNDIPERIRQSNYSILELFFCLVIFPQIRKFLREFVEVVYEFVNQLLLSTGSLKELDELLLAVIKIISNILTLFFEIIHNE
jgi:hypothetical protein